MRHKKSTFKIGRNSSHRRAMVANMLKSLIMNERIETTVAKAKALRGYADRMITLAKQNSVASKRIVAGKLMVRFNTLTCKEARAAKEGDTRAYNDDRKVVNKLFSELGVRFAERPGGYTRIIRKGHRVGDGSQQCIIEYLAE